MAVSLLLDELAVRIKWVICKAKADGAFSPLRKTPCRNAGVFFFRRRFYVPGAIALRSLAGIHSRMVVASHRKSFAHWLGARIDGIARAYAKTARGKSGFPLRFQSPQRQRQFVA
jgi:hypothetical protein